MPGPEVDVGERTEKERRKEELEKFDPRRIGFRGAMNELLRSEYKATNKEILEKYQLDTFNLFSLCFINNSNELQIKDGIEQIEGENTYIMINGEKVYKKKEGCNGLGYYFDGEQFWIGYYKNGEPVRGCYETVVYSDGYMAKGTYTEQGRMIDGRIAIAEKDVMWDVYDNYRVSEFVGYNIDNFYNVRKFPSVEAGNTTILDLNDYMKQNVKKR